MVKNMQLLFVINVLIAYGFSSILAGCQDTNQATTVFPQTLDAQTDNSAVPNWATCTVSLLNFHNRGHESLASARQARQEIQEQTGWSDLHIVKSDQMVKICRGYFRSFSDDKAQQTLQQVRSYRDSQGQNPFQYAVFAAVGSNKKEHILAGPPQWDLRQAPGNASLCIGFYVNDELCADRLNAAIKEVRKLRAKGIEAWYYHGQYRSGVYVGHFNAQWQLLTTAKTATGHPIKSMKLVTTDPQYKVLREKFPKYHRNREVQSWSLGNARAYESSILALIPRHGKIPDSEAGLR